MMTDDKSQKPLSETILLASHAQRQLFADFQSISESVLASQLQLKDQSEVFASWVKEQEQVIAKFQKQFEELAPILKRVAEAWASFPKTTRRALNIASERGWYVGAQIQTPGDSSRIVALAEQEDTCALDGWFADGIRTRVDSISARVVSSFPTRSAILIQAFEAHKRKRFAVSIPTMLAQADGIHFDLVDQPLFRKNYPKPLRKRLEQIIGKDISVDSSLLSFVFLRPLLQPNALRESTASRELRTRSRSNRDPLNRHEVLHGIDLDYATELHSLRSIALLDFLQWVQTEFNQSAE